MITKHFFKTLLLFTGIIILGLVSIFLISYFDKSGSAEKTLNAEGVAN